MKQKYELYNPQTGKISKVSSLYSQQAKQIYIATMEQFGWDWEMLDAPADLSFSNGWFKYLPKTIQFQAGNWRGMSSEYGLNGMVQGHSIINSSNLPGLSGFNLINHFKPVIKDFLGKHGACTRLFAVKVRMIRAVGTIAEKYKLAWERAAQLVTAEKPGCAGLLGRFSSPVKLTRASSQRRSFSFLSCPRTGFSLTRAGFSKRWLRSR